MPCVMPGPVSSSRGGLRNVPQPMDRKIAMPDGRWALPEGNACYQALILVSRHPERITAEEIDHIRYWCVRYGHENSDPRLIETAYRVLKRWEPVPCSRFRPHHKGNKKKKCVECGFSRVEHLDVQAERLLRLRERLVEAR